MGEVSEEARKVGMKIKRQKGNTKFIRTNEESLITPVTGSPSPLLPVAAPASPLKPSIQRDATCWPAQGTTYPRPAPIWPDSHGYCDSTQNACLPVGAHRKH